MSWSVMFSFAGTAQDVGAGVSSGAAGIPVRGLLMGRLTRFFFIASFTFLLVHCGSLVSTLVLLSVTECSVAFQWSPIPVGMVRLVCSLNRFPSRELCFRVISREGKRHVTKPSS